MNAALDIARKEKRFQIENLSLSDEQKRRIPSDEWVVGVVDDTYKDFPIAEVTVKFDFADGVLSQAFVATNPAMKCVAETQDWYGFDNGVWLPRIDPRQEVAKFLHSLEPTLENTKTQERIHQQLYSSKKLRDVLFQLQNHPSLLVSEVDFDADPMLLGLPGGECLNLRDGSIRKTTREDLISKVMPCAPAPEGAKHEKWEQFLNETHLGDEAVIRFMQEWAGMCLTADVSADILLFLRGAAGAGKGTTIKPFQTLLGPYAMAASKVMLVVGSDEARRDNYLAQLLGKRLVVCGEG
jgi:phage/plasmid-associated DNA primase